MITVIMPRIRWLTRSLSLAHPFRPVCAVRRRPRCCIHFLCRSNYIVFSFFFSVKWLRNRSAKQDEASRKSVSGHRLARVHDVCARTRLKIVQEKRRKLVFFIYYFSSFFNFSAYSITLYEAQKRKRKIKTVGQSWRASKPLCSAHSIGWLCELRNGRYGHLIGGERASVRTHRCILVGLKCDCVLTLLYQFSCSQPFLICSFSMRPPPLFLISSNGMCCRSFIIIIGDSVVFSPRCCANTQHCVNHMQGCAATIAVARWPPICGARRDSRRS